MRFLVPFMAWAQLWTALAAPQLLTIHVGKSGPAGGVTAITLDGSNHCGAQASANTVTCNLPSVTAGDLIVCEYHSHTFGTNGVYVSDTTNGIYTTVLQSAYQSGATQVGTAYFANSASGSISPVANASSSNNQTITCQTFKNVSATNPVDGAFGKGRTTTSTNPTSGTAQTPANANQLISAFMANANNTTPTAGSGMTLIDTGQQMVFQSAAWPAYSIQTTATSTNCPYTAASDAWIEICASFLNASSSGGVTPAMGMLIDYAGGTNGTAITETNLTNGTHTVTPGLWAGTGLGSAAFDTTASLPAAQTPRWINGVSYPANLGIAIKHTANTAESWLYQFAQDQTGTATMGFLIKTDYTANSNGDNCDLQQISVSGGGDSITLQYHYQTSGGFGYRMERQPSTAVSTGIHSLTASTWYWVEFLLNLTNSGNQTMNIYGVNQSTGVSTGLIGTDTIAVSGGGAGSGSVAVSLGNQGSCSAGSAHVWYGPIVVYPTAQVSPIVP